MAIVKIDHTGILAKDPAPVIDFYKKYFGFELVSEEEIPLNKLKIFNLKSQNAFIEILQPAGGDLNMTDGVKHIAFLSDNIEEDFEFFKSQGAKVLNKEVQNHDKISFFFVKSPSGEFAEVIQYK